MTKDQQVSGRRDSMTVKPKKDTKDMCQMYGDFFGMSVELNLQDGQKWKAKKSGGYWWLSRKGTGIRLRLTDSAMWRMFEECNE